VLDAGTAVMETLHKAGRGDADYSVVFESFAPNKKHGPANDEAAEEAGPFKKMRITLKASKFQVDDGEEDNPQSAEVAKA
jgi:hypothetical protein